MPPGSRFALSQIIALHEVQEGEILVQHGAHAYAANQKMDPVEESSDQIELFDDSLFPACMAFAKLVIPLAFVALL